MTKWDFSTIWLLYSQKHLSWYSKWMVKFHFNWTSLWPINLLLRALLLFFPQIYFFFFNFFWERGSEKYHLTASCMPTTGNRAHNLSICPDWESKKWPLGPWNNDKSTEPHTGQALLLYLNKIWVKKRLSFFFFYYRTFQMYTTK